MRPSIVVAKIEPVRPVKQWEHIRHGASDSVDPAGRACRTSSLIDPTPLTPSEPLQHAHELHPPPGIDKLLE